LPVGLFDASTAKAQIQNNYNDTQYSPNATNSSASITSSTEIAANNNNTNQAPRQQNFNINFQGQSADAYWYSYPASYENGTATANQTYTDVQIFASDQSYRAHRSQQLLPLLPSQQQPPSSQGAEQSSVYVGIYQYIVGKEVCVELPAGVAGGGMICYRQDVPVVAFSGYVDNLTQSEFQVDKKNEGATLNTTVNGFDWASNSSKIIDINVRWTGIGGVSSGNSNYHVHSGDYNYNSHSVGSSRTANVTATIAGDIEMTLDSPPLQYEYGNIYAARTGEVSISHPLSP
jgi:hypothetical protein